MNRPWSRFRADPATGTSSQGVIGKYKLNLFCSPSNATPLPREIFCCGFAVNECYAHVSVQHDLNKQKKARDH